jgi:hypothetical protein
MQVFPLNTAYFGEQTIFEVVATDALNRPIPNYSLNITDLSTGISTVEEFPFNETRICIPLQLVGPLGNHVIQFHSQSEVSNFISNGTLTINYIVWSKPEICLTSSSVDHFASPAQTITLEISVSNWQGNLSFQPITILYDGLQSQILTTNLDGVVLVTTTVPKYEGTFNLSLFLEGDLAAFQMATRYDYIIEVTRRMPAEVVLESYEIVFPLKEIVVRLSVRGLNGTLLEGIDTQFRWQENLLSTTSMSNGNIELRLPIPTIEGIHTLDYYLNSTWSLEARNGAFQILVTSLDILSAEGLGFQLVGLSILGSIALVSIPAIARKRLGI